MQHSVSRTKSSLPNTKIPLIDTLWFLASQCLISIMSVGGLVHFFFLWFACTVHSGCRAKSVTRAFSVNCWPPSSGLQLLCRFQMERGQLFYGINLHYICLYCFKREREKQSLETQLDSTCEKTSKQQHFSGRTGEEDALWVREWSPLESQVAQWSVTSDSNMLCWVLENWDILVVDSFVHLI